MSDAAGPSGFDITPITIEEEMKRSYLDYAMSVIVSRALPDVRDGLKPVHRRILFAMKEGGYDSTKSFKKSSRIVGDVMGKYHPHGDAAIYEAMVRMAQEFSLRLPLVQGQGNFGSMDGDPAAAMRYTEARLAKSAESMLEDIDKDTVDYQPNYDESQSEPLVLPARFPNLLVNGAGGIAVGMATNIPPHNLGEVIDACCAVLDDPDTDFETLLELLPGPDFPTGGIILGRAGVRSALATGRGSVVMRGRTHFEDMGKDRQAIVVTEIPYQVNKSRMIERIAEVVREKQVEGISDLRDESDRDGVRVVIELRRDAVAEVVLAQLFRFTPLQTSFGVNQLALNNGRPELLNARQVIDAFLVFRRQVISRRTAYELRKARERAHVLVGLAVAVANVDEVVALIRRSQNADEAREGLMSTPWPAGDVAPLIALVDEPERPVLEDGTYRMSEAQARAILDLRLHRLTGLERDKIGGDLKAIVEDIADYLDVLGREERLLEVLRGELVDIKEQFSTPRRTEISDVEFEADIEDLIKREDMVVTVTNSGYVKRVALDTYRAQKRGGKGRSGMATKDEDFVTEIFVANTHIPLLLFSSRGIAYKLKVYRLPIGTPQARGRAFVNLLPLEPGETITTVMPLPEDEETWASLNAVFATRSGGVRRNKLSDFTQINRNGKIAMKLDEGDSLIGVQTCDDEADVMLATRLGKCIRFSLSDVRVFSGRTSTGVRGIRLAKGDEVISLSILKATQADAEQRAAFLKHVNALRKAEGVEDDGTDSVDAPDDTILTEEQIAEMMEDERIILTVSAEGYGKRSSSHAYRRTNRGGQGIWNMEMGDRNTAVAGCFPVSEDQEMILATDGGQVIRCPVDQVRLAARKTLGVTIFRVDEGEKVVSVAAILDPGDDETGEEGDPEDGSPPEGGPDEAGSEEAGSGEPETPPEGASGGGAPA